MKYIDLHADTILPILQQGEDASLYENSNTHIDIKRLQKGQALAHMLRSMVTGWRLRSHRC